MFFDSGGREQKTLPASASNHLRGKSIVAENKKPDLGQHQITSE